MRGKPMASQPWNDLVLRPALEPTGAGGTGDEASVWELYHDNSKTSRYDPGFNPQHVLRRTQEMYPSLLYDQYPEVELPRTRAPLPVALDQALLTRTSARGLT